MKKTFFILLLLYQIGVFSQSLEERIYDAAEVFIANPNDNSILLLNRQESRFIEQVQTKGEQLALVFLQCNKAYYLNKNSQLDAAISSYEQALSRFRTYKLSSFSDFDITEACLKPLGNLYTKTGNFTNALGTINDYLYRAKKNNNTKHEASAIINLAILYATLGNHDKVVKITSAYIDNPGINMQQNQKLKAVRLDSQLVLGIDKQQTKIVLDNEPHFKIALKKGDYQKALSLFKKDKIQLLKNKISKREHAKLQVQEAQIYQLLNQKDAALKSLKIALEILIPNFKNAAFPDRELLYAENTFIDVFDTLAALEIDANRALNYYDLSFYVTKLLQKNWTSQETKILNQTAARHRAEKCIGLLYKAYSATKDKSLLFKAFLYSENHKVAVLKDNIYAKQRLKRHPEDTLLLKEVQLLKEQEQITSRLLKEQFGVNRASQIHALSVKLGFISTNLKQLKKAIIKVYPDEESSFSLKTLQNKLLKEDLVLCEYFYGKNHLFQFVISNHDISLHRTPLNGILKKEITDFIGLFNEASIINNDVANYNKLAFKLYQSIGFNFLSPYKRVLVLPDGLLNFIPFEALLTQQTSTVSFSKMPFVVRAQNILYNSSVHFYLTPNTPSKSSRVLGFFPVFKNTPQALNHSIQEAETIKDKMEAVIFMENKASKANFMKHANQFDVLHLSTHASAGNFRTPAYLSFYKEKLPLNELYTLDLNSKLVVLSACETGVGKLYKGEGAMSIARGFQYTGVENLLFSLWQINDLSTSQIMQLFYNAYSKNHSVYLANQDSKLAYLKDKTISNSKKSPYYWSAFVFYGTPDSTPEQNFSIYVLLGLLTSLIILFLALKHIKNGRDVTRVSS